MTSAARTPSYKAKGRKVKQLRIKGKGIRSGRFLGRKPPVNPITYQSIRTLDPIILLQRTEKGHMARGNPKLG